MAGIKVHRINTSSPVGREIGSVIGAGWALTTAGETLRKRLAGWTAVAASASSNPEEVNAAVAATLAAELGVSVSDAADLLALFAATSQIELSPILSRITVA